MVDGSGEVHAGLIKVTLPILKARGSVIKQIKARAGSVKDVRVVDLTEPAQTARTYEEYVERMASLTDEDLDYIGVALYGGRQSVNKLTGNLSLLR